MNQPRLNRKEEIGKRIRTVRHEQRLTRPAFGYRIGLSESSIQRIEHGDRHLTFEEAILIAKFLHISLDFLAGNTTERKPYGNP